LPSTLQHRKHKIRETSLARMELAPDQQSRYVTIIDGILRDSDLATISAKKIRLRLAEKLGYDISEQKDAITVLIMERFDKANQQTTPPRSSASEKAESTPSSPGAPTPPTVDEDSDVEVKPPKKKIRRSAPDSDAKLAALLQAEENSRNRPTRGGVNKKPVAARKKKSSPKKKSAAKIKADDDSDMDLNTDGEMKEVVRKGGFHKQYSLSQPLADLVGEPQLSRPQVVKKIWEYIKARDLQDPSDKRQIRCDDRMQSVFKTDRVHMFTMNKILGKQLYPVDEA